MKMLIKCTTTVEIVPGQVVKPKLNTSLYMRNGFVMSFRKGEQQLMMWKNKGNYLVHSKFENIIHSSRT